MDIRQVLKNMTSQEKDALICGRDTGATAKVGDVPSLVLERFFAEKNDVVRFACAAAIGCGFDERAAYDVGCEVAKQCCALGIHVIETPSFLPFDSSTDGGRSRYFSDEPTLSRVLAAAFIDGVQSTGVGAMPPVSGKLGKEKAEQLYLAVAGDGKTVCRPRAMLFDGASAVAATAKEMGYDGACVSEWGTVKDRAVALNGGIDLSMPMGCGEKKNLQEAAESGYIDETRRDAAALKVLELIDSTFDDHAYGLNGKQQRKKSASIAGDCAVLLKNEAILPLLGDSVTVMGQAGKAVFTGDEKGSCTEKESLVEAFEKDRRVKFVDGYRDGDGGDAIIEALEQTFPDETVIVVLGAEYPDCVGNERSPQLPENQVRLVERLEDSGRNVVAVVTGGGEFDLKRVSSAKAVIYAPYLGSGGAEALKQIICGETCPSGRLAEDFTTTQKDGTKRVLYPFGYGESYCRFSYSQAKLGELDGKTTVSVTVTNEGRYTASDVIQIYVDVKGKKRRLAAFEKAKLRAGEARTLTLVLPQKLLYGAKELLICTSREDVRERLALENSKAEELPVFTEREVLCDVKKTGMKQKKFSTGDSLSDMEETFAGKMLAAKVKKASLQSADGDGTRGDRIFRAARSLPAGALPSFFKGRIGFKAVKAAVAAASGKRFKGLLIALGIGAREH